jgi:hypothetical protein
MGKYRVTQMNIEERSKYLKVPVTLNGKPARISGTALRFAEIMTTERDYNGDFTILKIPWKEVIKTIEEEGGNFYGGKRYVTSEERQHYAIGFIIGILTVIFALALIEIFSR